jgi:hypothetical protein
MFSQCVVFNVLLEQKLVIFFQLKKPKKKNEKERKKKTLSATPITSLSLGTKPG